MSKVLPPKDVSDHPRAMALLHWTRWASGNGSLFHRGPQMFSPGRVLYEDNHLLVINKEAGDLTQGDSTGDLCLLDQGKNYLKEKYQKPGNVFLGIVHRLDRPVSGVLLFARTSKSASRMAEQFREHTTRKIYQAIVEGRPPKPNDELSHYLINDQTNLKSFVSQQPQPDAKLARLRYRVLASKNERTLLEVELLTGYKHQIRAQLAELGNPIIGDFKYGQDQSRKATTKLLDGRAIALHALTLTVRHPIQKHEIRLEAPLPAYWPWR